jgi:HlyD family type I secretion membrane fusion protein
MIHGCPSIDRWHEGVPRNARLPTVLGFAVLLAWALGFGVWALVAPLASAVVASGSFVATGQNKQVQHFEGGIIREILVKEGDLVEANQPLVRLDETAVKSKLRRLTLQKYRLIATSARLRAEIESADQIRLPPLLAAEIDDPVVDSIYQAQEAEFRARRTSLLGQEEVLRKEIAGLLESIRGYQSQVSSNHARLALFDEELKAKNSLLDQQLIRRSEILALRRSEVSLSGELGELLGRIGDAKERIARAEQQIVQLRSAAIQKAIEELHRAESGLDDVTEQIRAVQDVVERTDVRAPVRGTVVKLNQYTVGGVVAPGGNILELLPFNDELMIEARVNPNEITHVKSGQHALVRLTALNQRLTPMIDGKVIYLSADIVPEHSARQPNEPEALAKRNSFIVRVKLDESDLQKKIDNFRPSPGMPADVFIETGQRTFFNYLIRPVSDSLSRAFREH